jgi:hypothetical protein
LLIIAILKTLLTPILLDFLIIEGYEYCLSKTAGINTQNKSERLLNRLSNTVDKYFNIKNEPMQMAGGGDETLVMVEIDSSDLKRYINFFIEKLAMSKPFFKPNLQN